MLCDLRKEQSRVAIKLSKSNTAVRGLLTKSVFVQHLDRAIGAGELEWEFKHTAKTGDDGWHPSSHCVPSAYELYHYALNKGEEEEKFAPSTYKTFMVGHFWHSYLQYVTVERLGFAQWEHIERRGYRGWGEQQKHDLIPEAGVHYFEGWKPFHYATGSADIAPVTIPNEGDFLADIKTMGAHDFKRNGLPDWCAVKYEAQLNVYMDFFDLERALIVGVLKDSPHDLKEWEFHRNQPLIDAIYMKWELVSECLDERIEPPADAIIDLPIEGPVR